MKVKEGGLLQMVEGMKVENPYGPGGGARVQKRVDVLARVAESLNGLKPGQVTAALNGEPVGSVIRARRTGDDASAA